MNIPKNYIFLDKIWLFGKLKFENYNIFIDNIISVKDANVNRM